MVCKTDGWLDEFYPYVLLILRMSISISSILVDKFSKCIVFMVKLPDNRFT